jgi:hypothetical protein
MLTTQLHLAVMLRISGAFNFIFISYHEDNENNNEEFSIVNNLAVSQPSNLFYWPANRSLTEYLMSLIFNTESRSFG